MDTKTFTEKLKEHHNDLLGFGISLTKSRAAAEDLVQETSIRAYRHKDNCRDTASFKSWIFKIMKNTFLSHCEKNKRRRDIEQKIGNSRQFLVASACVSNSGFESLNIRDINSVVEQVSPSSKKAFKLFLTGYNYNEISEMLKIPMGTVKSRINYGRKIVRTRLVGMGIAHAKAS